MCGEGLSPRPVHTPPTAGFPQQTHFTFLEERGIDWKIYYNDDPWMAPTFQGEWARGRVALVPIALASTHIRDPHALGKKKYSRPTRTHQACALR